MDTQAHRVRASRFCIKSGSLAIVTVILVASAAWSSAAIAQTTGTTKTFYDYIQPTPNRLLTTYLEHVGYDGSLSF